MEHLNKERCCLTRQNSNSYPCLTEGQQQIITIIIIKKIIIIILLIIRENKEVILASK